MWQEEQKLLHTTRPGYAMGLPSNREGSEQPNTQTYH